MGTSSSSGGPSGKSSLLPTYYTDSGSDGNGGVGQLPADSATSDDAAPGGTDGTVISPAQTATAIPQTTGDWAEAKGAMTRYSKGTAGSSIYKAAKAYVRTMGGSRGATRSAARGRSVGTSLATFLGAVSSPGGGGLTAAMTDMGLISFIGKSSEEVLAKIADALAPTGATNDEAIARDAVLSTMDFLYTKILEEGGDISSLETLTPEAIKEAVVEFVSQYIYKKWIYELGLAVEKNTVSEKSALQMELEMKQFINAEVELSLKDKDIRQFDPNSAANRQTIDTIFQTAYSTIEQ